MPCITKVNMAKLFVFLYSMFGLFFPQFVSKMNAIGICSWWDSSREIVLIHFYPLSLVMWRLCRKRTFLRHIFLLIFPHLFLKCNMFFSACPHMYMHSIAPRAHFSGSFFSQKEDMIIQEVSQEEDRKQKEKGRQKKKNKPTNNPQDTHWNIAT